MDASEFLVIKKKKKKGTPQLVDSKKSNMANHLEREHSETRFGKLTSLVLFAFLEKLPARQLATFAGCSLGGGQGEELKLAHTSRHIPSLKGLKTERPLSYRQAYCSLTLGALF